MTVAEAGAGDPLIYLHGFADIHGSSDDWLPFHRALAAGVRVLAPAHPGCNASAENEDIDTIEDVVFHYLQVLDAIGIDQFISPARRSGGGSRPRSRSGFPSGCARSP